MALWFAEPTRAISFAATLILFGTLGGLLS
jgi:hypothetical protein